MVSKLSSGLNSTYNASKSHALETMEGKKRIINENGEFLWEYLGS